MKRSELLQIEAEQSLMIGTLFGAACLFTAGLVGKAVMDGGEMMAGTTFAFSLAALTAGVMAVRSIGYAIKTAKMASVERMYERREEGEVKL